MHVNPVAEHYLLTASLDRSIRIFDIRKRASSSSMLSPLLTLNDSKSVNCAYWNPTGTQAVAVTQSDFLRVLYDPQSSSGTMGVAELATSVRHNNQTVLNVSFF